MNIPVDLDLSTENQKFGLDMSLSSNEEAAKKMITSLRGTVVSIIDRSRLPVAVLSDGKYTQYLQSCSYDDKMKIFKALPLMLKDAILHKIPILTLEQFATEVKKRLEKNIERTRKRPIEETSPDPAEDDEEASSSLSQLEERHVLVRDSDPRFATLLKNVPLSSIVLHLGSHFGVSIFDVATPELVQKRTKEILADTNKEVHFAYNTEPLFEEHGPPVRVRARAGFCDYCKLSVPDVFTHCKSAEHQQKIDEPDGKFDELDALLSKFNAPVFSPKPKDWTNNNIIPQQNEDGDRKHTPEKEARWKAADAVVLQTACTFEPESTTEKSKVDSDRCPLRQAPQDM